MAIEFLIILSGFYEDFLFLQPRRKDRLHSFRVLLQPHREDRLHSFRVLLQPRREDK
jgi:hypothetical protein